MFGDALGLDLTVVRPELTLAGVNPAMAHLRDAAAESLRQAHGAADRLGRQLAERLAVAA